MKSQGKQERSRRTIRTILQAAVQVLIDEGFERATTNRIASRAGYSVGTLYQYFKNKEDIYREIVDQAVLKLVEATSNLAIQPSLIETLRAWLELILESFEQDPALIQALETLLAGKFREKRKAAYDHLVADTVRIFEAHRSEIVVEDLELAAGIIVAASAGLATSESARVLESPDLMEHVLRLQFAYLTFDT
ncbi:MAG: TetR/AcrR family transcriptional regulator [Halioglobus sp.]